MLSRESVLSKSRLTSENKRQSFKIQNSMPQLQQDAHVLVVQTMRGTTGKRGSGLGIPQGCNEVISILIRHKADADIAHS